MILFFISSIYYNVQAQQVQSLHDQILGEFSNQITDYNNAQIHTGDNPLMIINTHDTLYVTNSGSNTVSVTDTGTNTKIKDIEVGLNPSYMNFVGSMDTLYVSNRESGGISVIDPITNKLVAGITFKINPFNSGSITCNDSIQPTINRLIYIYPNTPCVAIPNNGFEFSSWVKNLDNNSTETIKTSYVTTSLLNSFLNIFGIKSEDKDAILSITEFGSFTANFKVAPPTIPSEYLIGLYTIVVTTIIGWSIPSIIGWIKSRGDIRKLNYYHKRIFNLYDDGKLDEKDIEKLDNLKISISDNYAKGKINSEHYANLKDEISLLYQEICNKKIDSLSNSLSSAEKANSLQKIKNDILDLYSKGKINELHYNLLEKKMSSYIDDSRTVN